MGVAEAHHHDVKAFFKSRGEQSRLLEVDITQGAGWEPLCRFLGVPIPVGEPFPRVDVMELSWFLQPWWQLQNLWHRVRPSMRLWAPVLFAMAVLVLPRLTDYGQCTRACRVVHGTGSPEVLGHRGSWGDTAISGMKRWWDLYDPDTCICFTAMDYLPDVPRYHQPQPTADQWWFYTTQVCSANRTEH